MAEATRYRIDLAEATKEDRPCPYCGALLPPWRFDFAKRATAEDIQAALDNNPPGTTPEHAILHIPESY